MAKKICTACGYEGYAVRPPSDAGGEDESFLITVINKLIFLMTFMPIKVNFIIRLAGRGRRKHCPNCGLPLMVSLKSDAGWLAKRKQDIKAGLRFDQPEGPVVSFGKEIILPGDEKAAPVVSKAPVSLPSLDALLDEQEISPTPAKEETVATPVKEIKKTVDPDQW